jgi:ATP synthase I chain
MAENANNTSDTPVSIEVNHGLNGRVFRAMTVTTGLMVIVSLFFLSWRITTGLLIGGLLALFSHRWLKNSAAAALTLSIEGGRPQLRLAQFVLRYVIVGAIVFAAYTLDLVTLPAILVGLSSFVVALFIEALREFYFAITKRGEIN